MSVQHLLEQHSNLHILGECFELTSPSLNIEQFSSQVHLLPAADNALIGVAIGMALDGSKVIVQLAAADSLWGCISHLGQELDHSFPLSIGIRVPFLPVDKIPWEVLDGLGIEVWCPQDQKQLQCALEKSIHNIKPTIILESYLSLKKPGTVSELNDVEQRTEGEDVTLFAWGNAVSSAIKTAKSLEKEAVFVEVLVLNKILPLESTLIAKSLRKTGRAVFINAPKQLLHTIVDQAFWSLESQPITSGTTEEEIRRALFESLS